MLKRSVSIKRETREDASACTSKFATRRESRRDEGATIVQTRDRGREKKQKRERESKVNRVGIGEMQRQREKERGQA